MSYIRIRIDIVAKDYPNRNEGLTFLVPSGESSEWIFERIEQFRDSVLFKDSWRKANMDMKLQCSLVSEEQLQVDRINKRFGAKIAIPKYVDVSTQNPLYENVIYPLGRIADSVEQSIEDERKEDSV